MRRRLRTFIAFALVAGMAACHRPAADEAPRPAVVAAPALDVTGMIRELGPLDEARVVTNPGAWEHPAAWTSDQMLSRGCQFRSNDPAAIARLVALLPAFGFHLQPHPAQWDKQHAIVFHARSGAELRIVLGGGSWADLHQTATDAHTALEGDYAAMGAVYAWALGATFIPIGDAMIDNACRQTIKGRPGAPLL